MGDIEVDLSELQEFFKKLSKAAAGDFKDQLKLWFDAVGMEFLDIIQDEIIRKQVVDTRLLLTSFGKGGKGNIWHISDGGLTLEIGTNVKYAKYVNDGHRQKKRWVPGIWSGGKFVYTPGAKTGMMLTEKFIEGRHYWESATIIFQKTFNKSLEKKLDEWMQQYF